MITTERHDFTSSQDDDEEGGKSQRSKERNRVWSKVSNGADNNDSEQASTWRLVTGLWFVVYHPSMLHRYNSSNRISVKKNWPAAHLKNGVIETKMA